MVGLKHLGGDWLSEDQCKQTSSPNWIIKTKVTLFLYNKSKLGDTRLFIIR
jgi:hypothetical protein